jgi:hypothetical protein
MPDAVAEVEGRNAEVTQHEIPGQPGPRARVRSGSDQDQARVRLARVSLWHRVRG